MKRNILDYFGVMCAKTFSSGLNIFHTIKIIRNAPLAQLDSSNALLRRRLVGFESPKAYH